MPAFPPKTNYAAGDVLTAAQMNDVGNALSAYQYIAAKNKVINGGFDIWQRGTSFTNPTNSSTAYCADRWQSFRAGYQTGITTTRQSSSLTGFQYCLRQQRNSGNTATDIMYLLHNLETNNSIPLAGQTVTLSFYARRGADNLGASNSVTILLASGTGTDQNLITTGSYTGNVNLVNTTFTATTSWQRFTYTATVGTTATQLGIRFAYTPTGTAGSNEYLEVTGVQLEIAPTASPFTIAGGNIGGELAACQRYYEKSYNVDVNPGTNTSTGMVYNTGASDTAENAGCLVFFKVPKRSAPTVTFYQQSGTINNWVYTRSGVSATAATAAAAYIGLNSFYGYVDTNATFTIANVEGHWTASSEL